MIFMTYFEMETAPPGLVIYARYYDCDPISSKLVSTKDQLLPLFVMDLVRLLHSLDHSLTSFPN